MSGIILSLLGSIGGLSLGIGTMISHDILSPLLKITDDKKLLRLTKLTVLAVMILASLIAIMNRGQKYFSGIIFLWDSGEEASFCLSRLLFSGQPSQCGLGGVLHGGKYYCRYHRRVGKISF